MILYKITFKVILQKQDVFSLNKALIAFYFKNYGSRSKKGEIPRFELSHNALNRKPQK